MVGFILAILIGISLGLIGSGGSILTIPVLVYLFKIEPSNATTYSLFIVGISALAGSIKGIAERKIGFKSVLFFGIPSVLAVLIMRKFIVLNLPETFFVIGEFVISKDFLILLSFAVLMIFASISMIKNGNKIETQNTSSSLLNLVILGFIIGTLTGFVGVGGGFLIIPTLLFYGNLSMKNAVATSLVIIALNALVGFAGSIHHTIIEWQFLLFFTALAIVGILLGLQLSKRISNEKLKPAFGWVVLVMGIYIIIKETIFK